MVRERRMPGQNFPKNVAGPNRFRQFQLDFPFPDRIGRRAEE
jgi:hypothetical protein